MELLSWYLTFQALEEVCRNLDHKSVSLPVNMRYVMAFLSRSFIHFKCLRL